jgi:hypothetical protein
LCFAELGAGSQEIIGGAQNLLSQFVIFQKMTALNNGAHHGQTTILFML